MNISDTIKALLEGNSLSDALRDLLEIKQPDETCLLCNTRKKEGGTDACLECLETHLKELELGIKDQGHRKVASHNKEVAARTRRNSRRIAQKMRKTIERIKKERDNS